MGPIYVVEIDVIQRWQRKGVGRRLMRHSRDGADAGASGVTLTTDRYVPFNAPFYASLGFRVLESDEMSVGLSRILRLRSNTARIPRDGSQWRVGSERDLRT